jgi:phenylalanyl-tRNA synthetase beta chain
MKISYNWLQEYIDLKLSPQEIAEKLTSIGLEVDDLYPFSTTPDGLDQLTIGLVKEVRQHPNADRLRLTKVDVGGPELLNIVCGAPNVTEGQKVVVATEGIVLHPTKGESFTIKKSKIRGEASEGMICAEDEIGIGTGHEGIMVLRDDAEIGKAFSEYMRGYKDWVIEIGLTPNRVDAASHVGVARDLAALFNTKIKYPEGVVTFDQHEECNLKVIIEDKQACPRYSGMIIRGVTVKDSPDWLQNRLKAIGLNPINNIVDATNYVLHELGHPLHAFDLDEIKGDRIIIKRSEKDQKFVTLDKQERELDGTELMIWNAEEPMAMAGIFGGLKSGITEKTKDIFIESAYFSPSVVRAASRKHQLFTDASFRFERGADPNMTIRALNRVVAIILEVAGGILNVPEYDEYPQLILPANITLKLDYLDKVAGMTMPRKEVREILEAMEIKLLEEKENEWLLEVPTFKTDVKRPIDVVEEILRIYSYDRLPVASTVKSIVQVDKIYEKEKKRQRINSFLVDQGFFETYLLSFTKEEDNNWYSDREPVPVLNPISADLGQLRNNLLIQGLKVLQHNINRQQPDVRTFKWGYTHHKENNDYVQQYHLAYWVTGNVKGGNWHEKERKADFYYLKAITDKVLGFGGIKYEIKQLEQHAQFDYGFAYIANGKTIGEIGKVSDAILKKLGIDQEVFYADFDGDVFFAKKRESMSYEAISRFPRVERDLALQVPKQLQYSDIRSLIEKVDNKLIRRISIFDVYQGEQLKEGLKSYAIRLEFEDKNQTLEDKVVDKIISKVISRLENELQVTIR